MQLASSCATCSACPMPALHTMCAVSLGAGVCCMLGWTGCLCGVQHRECSVWIPGWLNTHWSWSQYTGPVSWGTTCSTCPQSNCCAMMAMQCWVQPMRCRQCSGLSPVHGVGSATRGLDHTALWAGSGLQAIYLATLV